MTTLNIKIYKCKNSTDTEFEFTFNRNTLTNSNGYSFIACKLNYDINKYYVASTMELLTENPNVLIKSGQPIQIQQNGITIFQGIVLTAKYDLQVNAERVSLQLIPSCCQLALTNFVSDSVMADQIQKLTGVNISTILLTGLNQKISTKKLLNVMLTNTVYQTQFNHQSIIANDLPVNLRLITDVGDSKEIVLRKSLSWFNAVTYQKENGEIVIRQLDSKLKCPFSINYTNKATNSYVSPNNPCLAILEREYIDNALSFSTLSSYSVLDKNLAVGAKVNNNVLTVIPEYKYFDRIKILQNNGWNINKQMQIPFDSSFLKDPMYTEALQGMQSSPNQYYKASGGSATAKEFYNAYQRQLTQQTISAQMSNYWTLTAKVSIDNDYYLEEVPDLQGTVINIDNAPVKEGIITAYSKEFSLDGSFIHMVIAPVGTITGFWK
jgi:hypothetical protein